MNLMLELTMMIEEEIRREFNYYGLSGNLLKGIEITFNGTGYDIKIPAETYDVAKWLDKKIIVHNNKGSYVGHVNSYGKHQNFIERCVERALENYKDRLQYYNLNGVIENNE